MHLHKLEKIWLVFGIAMLVVFLLVVGVGAFAMGMQTPGGVDHHAINPELVEQTAPFDKPGLKKIGDNEFEADLIGFTFGYTPGKLTIPAGAKVTFNITSKDVVHGFNVIGTNINMMVVPGEINHMTYTFVKRGEYLVVCNEYCGAGHEYMNMTIVVE
ncbi:MAG TPA: cytochrome c oxidase subunit II [Bacilli bacterium]